MVIQIRSPQKAATGRLAIRYLQEATPSGAVATTETLRIALDGLSRLS